MTWLGIWATLPIEGVAGSIAGTSKLVIRSKVLILVAIDYFKQSAACVVCIAILDL